MMKGCNDIIMANGYDDNDYIDDNINNDDYNDAVVDDGNTEDHDVSYR